MARTYTRTHDCNGTFLIDDAPVELDLEVVGAMFGRPDSDRYPAKGYDLWWTLTDDLGRVVTLYDRFGVWRVGARRVEAGEDFIAWLKANANRAARI